MNPQRPRPGAQYPFLRSLRLFAAIPGDTSPSALLNMFVRFTTLDTHRKLSGLAQTQRGWDLRRGTSATKAGKTFGQTDYSMVFFPNFLVSAPRRLHAEGGFSDSNFPEPT
jgi:hypothetical protein